MKKTIFWVGASVLIAGIILFYYGYSTIQNIITSSDPYPLNSWFILHPEAEQQWNLAQMLQPIGLGLLVFGAIMLAYSMFVKT